ncbi:MAG: hypothetical protein HRU17_07575 [Polyangiaceae bacterium]|nr:hypothetical protein [Polyangiaceae bacterium]
MQSRRPSTVPPSSLSSSSLSPTCLLSAFVLCVACGSGTQPDAESADDFAHDNSGSGGSRRSGGMSTSAEIGALDSSKVTHTFEDALGDLQSCLHSGARRVEFLGGEIAFYLKINGSGQLVENYMERSSLGDHETEKCMLSALAERSWPKPEGGLFGIAQNSFDFDMVNDVRPPGVWDSNRVDDTIAKLSSKIGDCKGGSGGQFTATAYIDTNGSVLGVGVVAPGAGQDEASECLAGVVKGAKFDSPGSWAVKVMFPL